MLGYAGAMLLAGLLGSLGHCAGMCGPLVILVGLRLPEQGVRALPLFGLYHLGRLLVYALLGALAGAAASVLGLGLAVRHASGWISLSLGLALVLLGIAYASGGTAPVPQAAAALVGRSISRLLRSRHSWSPRLAMLVLGALNGLLPCGLVYASLLIAAASGSPATAALGMFLFGFATLPVLLVLGGGANAISAETRTRLMHIAGIFIAAVGVQLVLRGLAGLGMINHVMIGSVMLW